MKKIHLLLLLLVGFVFSECTPSGPRTIDRPDYGLWNSTTLEVDKVELTDSATILHIDAYFRPKNWIRIDAASYIQANGEKYMITGAEGIELDKEHWMPDSGEDHFKLFFPAVPKGTKSIDFIESDCDDCFKIWDINLTGKPKLYTPDLPKELMTTAVDMDYTLDAPVFKLGKTRVNLHITGWKEGFAMNPQLIVIHNVTSEQEEVSAKDTGPGLFTFECDLFSTSSCYLRVGQEYMTIYLAPGEEADVYYDLTAYSKANSRYNPEPDLRYVAFRGVYGELNRQLEQYKEATREYRIDLSKIEGLLDMNAGEFADAMLGQYREVSEKLQKADPPATLKQYITQSLKTSVVNYISTMDGITKQLYRQTHKINYDQPIDYKGPQTTDKELLKLKELNLSDPMWAYSSSFTYVATLLANIASSETVVNDILGTESGLVQDMKIAQPVIAKASGQQALTPEMEKQLDAASTPYYKEVYRFIADKSKRQYEEAMKTGGFEIMKTPAAAADKVVEAIVAQYKGKVVFVDFWATWCGPCLNAMKTIKPFKPEMAEKGVVSVYISNPSSPYAKWVSMLPDIGGLHYYLTDEEWKAVSTKYQIRGIPTYMIFDKAGKKTFETAGYPGNNRIKEELSKVW